MSVAAKTYCQEGLWFAVPLRQPGYAVGLVARVDARHQAAGYFFGPLRKDVPRLEELARLQSEDAVSSGLFVDLWLKDSKWPALGRTASWNRAEWPMPFLGSRDGATERHVRVQRSQDDFSKFCLVEPVSSKVWSTLPEDGVMAPGVVEIILTNLLVGRTTKSPSASGAAPRGTSLKKASAPRPDAEAEFNFYLYFASETSAKKAAESLAGPHRRLVVEREEGGSRWLTQIVQQKKLSPDELIEREDQMMKIAKRLRGEYDGFDRKIG
jgi:hypothetical protein